MINELQMWGYTCMWTGIIVSPEVTEQSHGGPKHFPDIDEIRTNQAEHETLQSL